MKRNSLMLATLASLAIAAPSFADGVTGSAASLVGSTTAILVDVPEGVVLDGGFKCPYKFTRSLAGVFGDEKGWKQNIVGALLGIPTGCAFGVPYGAIVGAKQGMTTGWDKPFTAKAFIVSNEEE